MPDTSMCADKTCPVKLECYRYWAEPKPDGERQPYITETYRVDDRCPHKNTMRFPLETVIPNLPADHRLFLDLYEHAVKNNLPLNIDFTVVPEEQQNKILGDMHRVYFSIFAGHSSAAGAAKVAPLPTPTAPA